jgi:cytochrome P450
MGRIQGRLRPERWEGDAPANIGWACFPLSGGPGRCLGEEFARMEASYTVVRLLHAFPVRTLPEGEIFEPVETG